MASSEGKSKNKPHIVAIAFPAQGHISPVLQICKKIAAQGFIVTFLNVDSIHEQLKRSWVAPAGQDVRLESIAFNWNIPQGVDGKCIKDQALFYGALQNLGPALDQVLSRLSVQVSHVVGIISDYFLPFTKKVADEHGIPHIVLWTGAANWFALYYQIEQLRATIKDSHVEELIVGLRGLSPFRRADLPNSLRRGVPAWFERDPNPVEVTKQSDWVLTNSFYDLEKDCFDFLAELHPRLVPVGPIFLLDGENPENVVLRTEDAHCLEWLDTRQKGSVLYISFGSVAVLSPEQFEELAQALEAAKQPFLWVIRQELVVGGLSGDSYSGFCERTSKQGYISNWAPQLKILAHPAIGGFLTHCGWNSVLESMSNGVPMLGWPWGAEQGWNLKHMIQDWKIAQAVTPGQDGLVCKDEIQHKVKLLMQGKEGEHMRKNALSMRNKARQAIAEGGQSNKNLKELLAFLVENDPAQKALTKPAAESS